MRSILANDEDRAMCKASTQYNVHTPTHLTFGEVAVPLKRKDAVIGLNLRLFCTVAGQTYTTLARSKFLPSTKTLDSAIITSC